MEYRITVQKDGKVNEADRQALASLLVKFGYKVYIGRERKDGKKTNEIFVAYEATK